MPMLQRARRSAPALVLILLATALLSSAASAKSLYPECDSNELTAEAKAGVHDVIIGGLPEVGTSLLLSCIAHEVVSVTNGQKDKSADYCHVEGQTQYPYRLRVRATYATMTKDGEMHRDFDIRDLVGGSLDAVMLRAGRRSSFTVYLENHATDSRCVMKVRVAMTYQLGTEVALVEDDSIGVPSMAALHPPIVYSGRMRAAVQVRASESLSDARYSLVPITAKCTAPEGQHSLGTVGCWPGLAPPSGTLYACVGSDAVTPGTYLVCYYNSGAGAGLSGQGLGIGAITVFSGNPAYFDVFSGQDDNGQIYVGKPVIIKFFGTSLDTRSDGDAAKLVEDFNDCKTGTPAGGVPVGTNLGPGDNYGPNTTYSLWDITIREPGAFKICYRRKKAEWTEVPFIDAVKPGEGPGPDVDWDSESGPSPKPTPAPIPVPVDPETGKACPMASGTLIRYKMARIEMTSAASTATIVDAIQHFFCVPRNALIMARRTTKSGRSVLTFAFHCEGVTDAKGRPACDNVERYNFAVGASKSARAKHGIHALYASTSMAAWDDDGTKSGTGTAATVAGCFTLLALAGLGAFTVLRYREKRQYMVQFGMDDADLDDMYHVGPAATTSTGPSSAADRYNLVPLAPEMMNADGGEAGRSGGGAVIEIED